MRSSVPAPGGFGRCAHGGSSFREVLPDGSGGHTDFEHELGTERTEAYYLAHITTLLAGLAGELVLLGQHGGGGGGADQSDLHAATVLAGSMEASRAGRQPHI